MKNKKIALLILVMVMAVYAQKMFAPGIERGNSQEDLDRKLVAAVWPDSDCINRAVKELLVVKNLLKNGANINGHDLAGTPILHIVVSKGSSDMLKIFLSEPKINVNIVDGNGESALWAAGNQLEAIYLLLEKGIDLAIKNKKGETFMEMLGNKIDHAKKELEKQKNNKAYQTLIEYGEATKKFIEVWLSFNGK